MLYGATAREEIYNKTARRSAKDGRTQHTQLDVVCIKYVSNTQTERHSNTTDNPSVRRAFSLFGDHYTLPGKLPFALASS